MRKLNISDAFKVARIIRTADLKDNIMSFAKEIKSRRGKGEKLSTEDIGLEFIVTMVSAMSLQKVEEQFYELYADLKGVSVDDIKTTDFATFKSDIKLLMKENDLQDFFHSASALT